MSEKRNSREFARYIQLVETEGPRVMQEIAPKNLKRFDDPIMPRRAWSKVRQTGGAVTGLGKTLVCAWKAGVPIEELRGVAALVNAWVDMLEAESDVDIRSLADQEQMLQAHEDVTAQRYFRGEASALDWARAHDAHDKVSRTLAAQLRRMSVAA